MAKNSGFCWAKFLRNRGLHADMLRLSTPLTAEILMPVRPRFAALALAVMSLFALAGCAPTLEQQWQANAVALTEINQAVIDARESNRISAEQYRDEVFPVLRAANEAHNAADPLVLDNDPSASAYLEHTADAIGVIRRILYPEAHDEQAPDRPDPG